MARKIEVEEIIGLLQKGFKEEVISFELHLPIEYIKECKRQLDKKMEIKKANQQNASKSTKSKPTVTYEKIKEMKEKYHNLKNRDLFTQEIESIKKVQQSDEEKMKIEKAIHKVEEKIEKTPSELDDETLSSIQRIAQAIKKISEYNLTIDQYNELMNLLDTLDEYKKDKKTNESLILVKQRITRRLVDTIDEQLRMTEDEKELQTLRNILPKISKGITKFTIDVIRRKLNNKINMLRSKNQHKENMSDNVIEIAESIATGKLHYKQAIQEIESEAKHLVSSKPQTKFSLTQEQQKSQIVNNICEELVRNADKYKITNYEQAIEFLNKLNGGNKNKSIRVIVQNLATRKEYEQAYKICNTHIKPAKSMEDLNNPDNLFFKDLRKDVISKELSDRIIMVIEKDIDTKSAIDIVSSVEDKIKKEMINPRVIKLGNTADKLKTITLEDIYNSEINEKDEYTRTERKINIKMSGIF